MSPLPSLAGSRLMPPVRGVEGAHSRLTPRPRLVGVRRGAGDDGSSHCRLRIRECYPSHRGATAVVRAVRPLARFMTLGG